MKQSTFYMRLSNASLQVDASIAGRNIADIERMAHGVRVERNRSLVQQNVDVLDRDRRPVSDLNEEHGEGLLVRLDIRQKRDDVSVVLHSDVAALLVVLRLEHVHPVLVARRGRSIRGLSYMSANNAYIWDLFIPSRLRHSWWHFGSQIRRNGKLLLPENVRW